MRILEVIESKRWRNVKTGATTSLYGAVPYHNSTEAMREAKEDAEDRVRKYIGDWHVTVRRVELSQDEISQLQRGFNR